MTNEDAIVRHLVWIATDNPDRPGDKAYAWSEAKRYASLYEGWAGIPDALTQRMLASNEAMKAAA